MAGMKKGELENLQHTHAVSSGLKALVTDLTTAGEARPSVLRAPVGE